MTDIASTGIDFTRLVDEFTTWFKGIGYEGVMGPRIHGIEATQSIQYFDASQHLQSHRKPDNSLELVAYKRTWIRVYLRTGNFTPTPGITGVLTVERRFNGIVWGSQFDLSPEPPGVATATPAPDYDTERSNLGSTLNFILPANLVVGNLRLTAKIFKPGRTEPVDQFVLYLSIHLKQTVNFIGLMSPYAGPDPARPGRTLTLAAPTAADLQTTAALTMLRDPLSIGTYRTIVVAAQTVPLTDARTATSGCSPTWDALITRLAAARTADRNQPRTIYYGLLPATTPVGGTMLNTYSGCGLNGLGTGRSGDQETFHHEVGHAFDFDHVDCNGALRTDPNYPIYEPYDPATGPGRSIGEYGLNAQSGNVLSPRSTRDYMGYCWPKWTSPYHYSRLIQHNLLDVAWVGVDHIPFYYEYDPFLLLDELGPVPPVEVPLNRDILMTAQPIISIIGVVRSETDLDVTSVMRVEANTRIPGAVPTDLTAELIGGNGQVIAGAPLQQLRTHPCGCGCSDATAGSGYPWIFQAFIPDQDLGSSLRLRRGDDTLWTREAPSEPTQVTSFAIEGQSDSGDLTAVWETNRSTDVSFDLRWSVDEGTTWNLLISGMNENRASIDLSHVPAGVVLIQLLAHDGFTTAPSDPVSVDNPERDPNLVIIHPREDLPVIAGGHLSLSGLLSDQSGNPVQGDSVQWLIDGEVVADRLDAWTVAPPAGEHQCTLVFERGGRFETTTTFATRDVGSRESAT